MTTEKHDPWALLREAQGWIGYWPLTKPEAGAEILKKRIDAALAEHDTPVVESDESNAVWRAYANRELSEDEAKAKLAALEAKSAALAEHADSAQRAVEWETDTFGNDYVKNGNVLSMVAQTLDGRWGWETQVEGYTNTEAEAKAAAIAAARGLK